MCAKLFQSRLTICNPTTVAHQAPVSMGFSRQEYWRGCHALLQGIFLTQGQNPYLTSPAPAGRFFAISVAWEALWLPWGWWFSHYVVSPWTVARQAPLFTGFPRQEHWSGLSFPPPGNLPDRGIKPGSPALQAYSLPTELPGLLYGHITSQAVGICLVILWPLLFLLLPSIFHSNGNQSIGDFVLLRCLRE